MIYKVIWDQWTRGGYHGDDKDFEEMEVEFTSYHLAEEFAIDLVQGKHRGMYDCKVNFTDIKIECNIKGIMK